MYAYIYMINTYFDSLMSCLLSVLSEAVVGMQCGGIYSSPGRGHCYHHIAICEHEAY